MHVADQIRVLADALLKLSVAVGVALQSERGQIRNEADRLVQEARGLISELVTPPKEPPAP